MTKILLLKMPPSLRKYNFFISRFLKLKYYTLYVHKYSWNSFSKIGSSLLSYIPKHVLAQPSAIGFYMKVLFCFPVKFEKVYVLILLLHCTVQL